MTCCALHQTPAPTVHVVHCCCADELWRHLQQLGMEREDQDAAVPFGKHPTKIIESMEHSK